MKGPAGVRKSAIADLCRRLRKLAATFFFSRPNHQDNLNHFFTSIHQLAVKFESYGDIIDCDIIHNPTLINKTLPHQFYNLLAVLIQKLKLKGYAFPELAIIVDGLDERNDPGA
ncbi:hypothetical protein P691DRAFT_844794 [Macrolepiota fuliginosa MF-IS2]|uniref:Uncharacterized protein n=1 Tax=Macrolepiota fuliginosa MF-IS2 TaxID=1400762 RepID=A0A9P6BYX8_9AGAR|nr:hypothetical protein P691DRAFT_844794 [Macrolepiota fuliginosa MF-IS2]